MPVIFCIILRKYTYYFSPLYSWISVHRTHCWCSFSVQFFKTMQWTIQHEQQKQISIHHCLFMELKEHNSMHWKLNVSHHTTLPGLEEFVSISTLFSLYSSFFLSNTNLNILIDKKLIPISHYDRNIFTSSRQRIWQSPKETIMGHSTLSWTWRHTCLSCLMHMWCACTLWIMCIICIY